MSKIRSLKKIISFIAPSAMSVLLSISAFAASGQISFSDPKVNSGQEVNVTMKIAADEGAKLQDATITLKYPSDQLTFVNGTDADGGAGTIRVHGASNGKGSNVLEYNLKFQTSGAGSFPITIDMHEVYDADGQAVSMTHLGSSNVQVIAPESVSRNSYLSSLEVNPGDLDPQFTKDNTEYTVAVGLNVEQLAVNAQPEDTAATVSIDNNAGFKEGENLVTVRVTAPDGETVTAYNIHVIKQEGGAEPETEAGTEPITIEGVQLSSKGKTITIMNPSKDVKIPDGFKQGTISIDGQKVQGWIWGADTDPKYCVVYGMNDQGELNFYRYDMSEKTIQRYFEDPLSADSVSNKEYTELKNELENFKKTYDMRFLIICILAVLGFAELIVIGYLMSKLRNSERDQRRNVSRRKYTEDQLSERKTNREPDPEDDFDVILKHDYEDKAEADTGDFDETQVIVKGSPEDNKLNSEESEDMGNTMMISSIHEADTDKTEAEDDEFETFDL